MHSNNNPFRLGKQYLKNYCLLTTYFYRGLEGNSIFKKHTNTGYKAEHLNIGEGSYFEIIKKRSSSFKASTTKLGTISSSQYHLLVIFKLNDGKRWASFGFGNRGPQSPDTIFLDECRKLYFQEQSNYDITDNNKFKNHSNENLLKLRKYYRTNQPSSKLRKTKKYSKWLKKKSLCLPNKFL